MSASDLHHHLLRARFQSGEAAAQAWHAWRKAADLDKLDSDSFLLLPTLGDLIPEWTENDPDRGILQGIVRQAWSQNQLHSKALTQALGVLRDPGFAPRAALGPLVWQQRYWPRKAVRRIQAADLLIAPEQLTKIQQALVADGWTLVDGAASGQQFIFGPPVKLRSASVGTIRLWSRAIPVTDPPARSFGVPSIQDVTIEAFQIPTVSAEDDFIAALSGQFADGIDWRADALMIATHSDLDWNVIAGHTRHRSLVRQRLSHLRDVWSLQVPDAAVEAGFQASLVEAPLASLARTYYRWRDRQRT